MTESDKDALASIEDVLVADRASPKKALEAAYALGRLQGMLEIMDVTERTHEVFDSTLKLMRGH